VPEDCTLREYQAPCYWKPFALRSLIGPRVAIRPAARPTSESPDVSYLVKQILQNLGSGETLLAEVPAPLARAGHLLIRTEASLVSLGTEKMLVAFGQANLLEKARQQPEKVKQVLQKIRTDGLLATVGAVRAKLDQPLPLGYCNAGTVFEVGPGVTGFSAGDRVASNGPHAEIVCVPRNLCCRIPDGVPSEAAPYTVVAAIAMQGIRLAALAVGETVVVLGLGLIGLLAVQILRASGCRVLGTDFSAAKCALARSFGAEAVELSAGADPVAAAEVFSRARGADAVLITASTKSSEPVSQAARMCRKRGRIVLVGMTGLELNRAEFYEKELSFQVSCSYGPGRYDPEYELDGHDYPVGFVRWTEQRNFEAVLDLLASGAISTGPLTSHRFPIARALEAYELVAQGRGLGILLEYPPAPAAEGVPSRIVTLPKPPPTKVASVVVAVIGAGNYTGQTLLPALVRTGARLRLIVSGAGVTAAHLGKKFGFEQAGTDAAAVFADPVINTVLITTRHDSHARFVIEGLRANKRVFVEKPLALTEPELGELESAWQAAENPFVLVGFNRRYAPQVVTVRRLLAARTEPRTMIMTVNTGSLPAGHWTLDPKMGGGRIVGEACHFVDLLRHLAGAPIVEGNSTFQRVGGSVRPDVASLQLRFADGSIGTVHYLANGSKDFPKERLEIFCGGGVLQLDNFRDLRGFGWPGFKRQKLSRQDKGHAAELAALVAAVRDGSPSPIPWEEIIEVSRWSIRLAAET
jgi:predicted dehydrogenase/threonine dehydrogenase-like Zn-dependent dehydrogenase